MTITSEATKASPRDFDYITPSRRRLSEYEAVTCFTQVSPQNVEGWNPGGWYMLHPDGRPPWSVDNTKLRYPNWYDFRDPAMLWQRTYTRAQAEQERAIDRATVDAVADGSFLDTDPVWLEEVIRNHYRVWSYAEYALFRAFSVGQREALSDTVSQVMVFEAFDRMRHAQDIVLYLQALEGAVPGFKDAGSKDRWLVDARYQPLRMLAERIMCDVVDWGELAIVVNLVFDPIVSEVALSQMVRRSGRFHGDPITPMIVTSAERDRRRNLAWTEDLVRMVVGDGAPEADQNRSVIDRWLNEWTPQAIRAAEGLTAVFSKLAGPSAIAEGAMSNALAGQRRILEGLGLQARTPA